MNLDITDSNIYLRKRPVAAWLMVFMILVLLPVLTCIASPEPVTGSIKTIKVVMDDNYPPYVFKDEQGKLKGILIDQWRLWENKTGIRVELTGMDWSEAQRRMQGGEFDVIDTIFKTEKRMVFYDFSRPYAKIDFSIFLHNDISGIRDAKDLKGFLVGVKSGGAVIDILKQFGVENIAAFPSDLSIVEAARDSKIKVFVIGHYSALYFLNKLQIASDYRQSANLFSAEFHRAVLKGNVDLLAIIENGFAAISTDEYQEIDKQWLGTPVGGLIQYKYLWYSVGVACVVVGLILCWLVLLRKAVSRKTGELAESEERYRSIIDNMQDVYYRSDAEGRLTMLSPSGAELLGYDSADGMLGCVIRDVFYFDPDERDAFLHNLKIKGHLYGYEVTLKRKNGKPIPVATSTHLMFAPDGTFMGVEGIFRDITCQRSVDEALRSSEDKFSRAFSQAPLLMTISDIETGRYIEVNNRFCEISGFSQSDAIGQTSLEIGWISPAERDRVMVALERDNRVQDIEVQLIAKDGRPVFCLYSAEVINVDGTDRLLSIAQDITQRKKDLEALDYANECFQQALSSTQHILYRLNVKKRCYDYLSPTFELVTGHPVDQFKQTSLEKLQDFFHPDDQERIFGLIAEKISSTPGKTFDLDIEYRLQKADGTYCWLHDSSTACLDDQGELECFFGTAHDITERRHTAALLKESEERYRQLVEQSAAWIWKTDAGLRHTYTNENVERILGYPPEEFCSMDIMKLVHPDDHDALRKTFDRAISGGYGWSGLVLRWLTRDGSWRSIESSGGPLFDEDGVFIGLQGVDTDLTDRLQLQHEREKGQRLESLGLLAGGIAHDFNNILTGIVGNLSLARMMIDRDHRAAERLEECEKAAKRASELTQQLLTFARGGEPVKKSVDAPRLLNEAVSFGLRGSSVKGVLELEDGLWPIYVDEGQINQVLNNLLINATQAMPDGGTVTVRGDNIATVDPLGMSGRFVRLKIRDTGVGIPPDILPKVFDPYFSTKQGGSGLGLASVYSIVTRHGGSVTVSSEAGHGTEFVICLPAAAELAPQEQDDVFTHSGSCGAERILVMDDEEMIIDVASIMLSELGFTVDTCSNGAEAVARYKAALEQGMPYDFVILDLTVPGGMGGLEAGRRIREMDPNATMIVSSGYSHDAVMADLHDHGFAGAVMKPYSIDTLIKELNRVKDRFGHRVV